MQEVKFTKGPWALGNANINDEAGVGIHGPGEYGFIICDMQLDGYDEKTQEANAALIAAAPELYEALECLLKADHDDVRAMARAALSKARGEQC